MSEFEALLKQGWTLIDPDGNVWYHPCPLSAAVPESSDDGA